MRQVLINFEDGLLPVLVTVIDGEIEAIINDVLKREDFLNSNKGRKIISITWPIEIRL